MIKAIEINISNGLFKTEAIISFVDKICYINNKKHIVNDDFLNKITSILLTFKEEPVVHSKQIDREECTINIYTDNNVDKYIYKGQFPTYYSVLKEMLGDLNAK